MMEYSFSTTDGTISSIALPTIQANNFDIKPSIIQIIRSSMQFYDLPEEDPNKHLSNFLEICDTFKFNGVQTFYNSVTLANRATIDAAVGGTIMKKLPSDALNIIDEIATNLYSYRLVRTYERAADVHSVDAIITLYAQMAALKHKVDNLGAVIWNGAPIGPCGAHGQMGHISQDCKIGSQFFMHEDANFICHGGRSNFNPYFNTYNPGLRNHRNFSWSNYQQQWLLGYQQPQQHVPQEKKSNLEDMFSNSITATNTRFQNQDASILNLEVQIRQLISIVSGRKEGQLPSNIEKNPREQVYMPSYAKFLKEVISNKRKWEGGETVKLNEECSAILQNKLPSKLKDPGSFSIPCTIENTDFYKALCDLVLVLI
ncbi:UNVERIFIED_CONTAM: hypothetical protein Sradi_3630700 [Sesamum radiatum]|uniref:Uncharacterized protein n=1 Tax=Sesamum radiatum TaxID=300843 RepID=A0AAW2QIA9_SESRA